MAEEKGDRRPGSWNSASLVIHSNHLTPDEISQALSTEPTDSGLKGTKRGTRSPPYKDHFWAVKCPLGDEVRIEEHISWLLDIVEQRVESLAEMISQGTDVRIQAAISDESGQYPMTFDAQMLQRLASVPLTLWLTAWMDSASDKHAEGG